MGYLDRMPKLLYAVRPPAGTTNEAHRALLVDEVAPALLRAGAERLKLSVSLPPDVRAPLLPLKTEPWALVSAWIEPGTPPERLRGHLTAHRLSVEAWQVTETIPRAYDRTWPDGEASPGVALVTLFRRRRHTTHARFLEEWHQRHTPMALEIHPLWNYVRNVVDAPLIHGTPQWDGIVEEHFRELADVTDLRRFYGGTWSVIPNMIRVGRHVNGFLDLRSIENHLAVEIPIRT